MEASMTVDPNSPKVLATLPTEVEAALVVNHLRNQGIEAHLSRSGSAAGWMDERIDIQVVVRQTDLARAKEALDLVRQTRQEKQAGGSEVG
jgi:hypothetical protein